MSGFTEFLDRTFFTLGGTRVTLGGLAVVVLIAAAEIEAVLIKSRREASLAKGDMESLALKSRGRKYEDIKKAGRFCKPTSF